ncbi:DUF4468 domain-containing protein [Hymenobacter sp.]|jgi:hypothetical protein|uniref:DUF4468 domain-containing protein n=1 Tax=Hymenobacter sp. TaxID=1898978 RepID=UPI002EDB651A
MKLLFIVSSLLSSVGLYAQTTAVTTLPVDAQTQRVTYSEIVTVDGVKQSELYSRAKLWLALTFDDAKDVIKVDEKDAGLLLIRAYTDLPIRLTQGSLAPVNQEAGYMMTLNFKDGRYKYTLTNYNLIVGSLAVPVEKEISAQMSKPKNKGAFIAKQYEEQVATYAKSLAESLSATLHKPVSGEDNW